VVTNLSKSIKVKVYCAYCFKHTLEVSYSSHIDEITLVEVVLHNLQI